MSDEKGGGVHWSFWAIGTIALIWNVLGLINFFVQLNPDMVAAYRESERAIIESRPVWATGTFAVAVCGGSLGCLLLLLKKPAAFYLFITSLLGVIGTTVHTVRVEIDFGIGEILGIIVLPLVVAAFLTWYSKRAKSKGWLR